jgi:hypothetical protein
MIEVSSELLELSLNETQPKPHVHQSVLDSEHPAIPKIATDRSAVNFGLSLISKMIWKKQTHFKYQAFYRLLLHNELSRSQERLKSKYSRYSENNDNTTVGDRSGEKESTLERAKSHRYGTPNNQNQMWVNTRIRRFSP